MGASCPPQARGRAVPAPKSRCGLVGNPVACAANSVANKKPRARQLPLGDIAFMCQSQLSCGHREQCYKIKPRARLPAPGGAVGGFGESRRFFRIERGTSSGFAPANRGKIAAHTIGKAASPNQGDIQGVPPLDHFCILFLREKDGGQCPLPNRAVASFETKSWATRTVSRIKLWARLADRRSAAKSRIKPRARHAARQGRVRRDDVADKTQRRDLPTAGPRQWF